MYNPADWPLVIHRVVAPAGYVAADADNDYYLLRDDLLPFSFGGNKVRIAYEFVRHMYEQGKNALVMYGDRCSNLCRVLAYLCHGEQISCVMVASHESGDEGQSFNARLVDTLGVEVITCDSSSVALAVDEAMSLLESRGYQPYYIYGDRLGRGNEGTAGLAYARTYAQLCAWEHAHDLHFDLVVTPYGTGATLGGLITGSLKANDGREVRGISISSRPRERALSILEATVQQTAGRSETVLPDNWKDALRLETAYNLGGYGKSNDRVHDFIDQMLCDNSVPMDPTYTGKAFLGMLDYIKEHEVNHKRVLFIHTGGTPLFYDYLNMKA